MEEFSNPVCVHSYKVPTKEELWDLATKMVERNGFKSIYDAVVFAINAKERENG